MMKGDNRYKSKDMQRKGDTKSLSKAIGVTTGSESKEVSPRISENEEGVVNLGPSSLKNRYESGPSITSDTEHAKASQKMYKTTTPIMVDKQPTVVAQT